MLKTRQVTAPKRHDDGLRILVMRPRPGKKMPDPSVTPEMFDQWWKELGPPSKLIGAYYREEIEWEEYAERFKKYLKLPYIKLLLIDLIGLAYTSNVTIMCIQETPDRCHRRLIAERCKEICPSLKVHIE